MGFKTSPMTKINTKTEMTTNMTMKNLRRFFKELLDFISPPCSEGSFSSKSFPFSFRISSSFKSIPTMGKNFSGCKISKKMTNFKFLITIWTFAGKTVWTIRREQTICRKKNSWYILLITDLIRIASTSWVMTMPIIAFWAALSRSSSEMLSGSCYGIDMGLTLEVIGMA